MTKRQGDINTSAKHAAARDTGRFDIAAVIAGEVVGLIHNNPDIALERRPVAVMVSFGSPVSFIDLIKGTGAILIYQAQSLALQKRLLQTGLAGGFPRRILTRARHENYNFTRKTAVSDDL